MPKQNQTTEEDYLDRLLNSVVNQTSDSDLKDDIFDEELKGAAVLDEDFFSDIEKGWINEDEKRRKTSPEHMAKEMFEKYKEPGEEEYRDVPPETVDFNERYGTEETETTAESSVEETKDNGQTAEPETERPPEDDMQGLYDILGVNDDSQKNSEIEELENENAKGKKQRKKDKKKKPKKKLFGRKKSESSDQIAVDIALDMMEDSQSGQPGENDESMGIADLFTEKDAEPDGSEGTDENQNTDGSSGIGGLMGELGLETEGLEEISDIDDLEEKPDKKEKKKAKKEKKEKKKKPKKPKKEKKKKPKKPKKERKPKEPDEIIPISLPFLGFMFSLGVLVVLGAGFGGIYAKYQSNISEATSAYVNQNYGTAYEKLLDLSIKESDEHFYGQVQTVMYVYRNYEAYQNLLQLEYYEDALDSLLNGVRMFDKYKDIGREEYDCFDDMNVVLGWITTALNDTYGINESEAREINLLGRGTDYSYRVAEIASQAKERNTQDNDSNN